MYHSKEAQWLKELMDSYVSLAQDANCVDEGMLSRAGTGIEHLDNAFRACELIGIAYASNGNTKPQKAAHAAVHDVLSRRMVVR